MKSAEYGEIQGAIIINERHRKYEQNLGRRRKIVTNTDDPKT